MHLAENLYLSGESGFLPHGSSLLSQSSSCLKGCCWKRRLHFVSTDRVNCMCVQINVHLRSPLGRDVLTLTAVCTDPPSFDIVDALRTQQNDSRWGHYVQQVCVSQNDSHLQSC